MRKLPFISHQAFFTEDTIVSGPKLGKSVKRRQRGCCRWASEHDLQCPRVAVRKEAFEQTDLARLKVALPENQDG